MEEINLGSATKRTDIYHSLGKYLYVPITLLVFVLGVIYGGIG